MSKKDFLKIIKQNAKEVKTWAKWKQQYIISAEAASTGRFLNE